MSDSSYTIRNYQPADFNTFVLVSIQAEKLEPTGRHVLPQLIAEQLGRPQYSPEQDLFIAEMAGSIIGYLNLVAELAIGRVILDGWVHPEHRQRGLATTLLGYATHRAQELGAKALHINIAQDNTVAQRVLSRLGFACVRRFLVLRLEITKLPAPVLDEAAAGCRYLRRGEEDQLARIQNRSFAGTWGYNPNTVAEITYHTRLPSFSPEDVVLTAEGDKIIGYCWTRVTREGEAAGTESKGRILMVGVDPDYRGRGVGRRVLLAGLAHLKDKGVTVAELTVDSANEVALALYRSVSFEVVTTSLWHEKFLD